MAKTSEHFFMTPLESAACAREWMQKFSIIATVAQSSSEYIEQVLKMPYELEEYIERESLPEKIFYTLDVPVNHTKSEIEFISENSQCLLWQIGRQTEVGLELSIITTSADEEESLQTWRKLMNELNLLTKNGLAGMKSGLKTHFEKERYTEGALNLHRQSIKLIGPGSVSLWPSVE
jgi:hypothetical protein